MKPVTRWTSVLQELYRQVAELQQRLLAVFLASHSLTITNTGSFTITATDSAGVDWERGQRPE